MTKPLRLLAVLVNYGEDQLQYLYRVIKGLKSFQKYDVTVVVNSNIPLDDCEADKINLIKLDDYQMLPMTCRSTIWNNRDDFDVFLFGENDHLFREVNVDRYLEYESILPKNRISGLLQFEDYDGKKFFPAYHGRYDWDYGSLEIHEGKKFAHFTNLHQATFILSKEQLLRIGAMHDFTNYFSKSGSYSSKCRTNTDIYQFCGMKKLICLTDFEDNLIQHLPGIVLGRHNKKFKGNKKKMGKWDDYVLQQMGKIQNNLSGKLYQLWMRFKNRM